MNVLIALLACLLLVQVPAFAGELLTTSEAARLLRKMSSAARSLNYSGVYMYRHGDAVETFRLTHVYDAAGEQERRESLDGVPREFVRNNDQIFCYVPDLQPIAMDRRTANKFFPGVIADQVVDILVNYVISRGPADRVAGHECQGLLLEPRDRLRHSHHLCYEPVSGLLLKTTQFAAERREPAEQFAFLQLEVGGSIDRRNLKPGLAGRAAEGALPEALRFLAKAAERPPVDRPVERPPVDSAAIASLPEPLRTIARLADKGAQEPRPEPRNLPSGFRLLKQTRGGLPGKPGPVSIYVFTDGLAMVSVFVEPAENAPFRLPVARGALNVSSRQLGGWMVTALGEVPSQTVELFTQAMSPP